MAAGRTGRPLLLATRPYAAESRALSWWHLASTFAVLLGSAFVAAAAPWWPLRLAAALVTALTMVRAFILFHDFHHGAIFRGSRLAKAILNAYGLVLLTPPRVWRATHNYHHAHTAQTEGPQLGTSMLLTTTQWREASAKERFNYRIERHPLTFVFGYVTVFIVNFALVPFLREPRRYWDSGLALLLHAAIGAGIFLLGGAAAFFFAFLIPFVVAEALGSYLFYAQHNFEGMRVPPRAEWSHTDASLGASSYVRFGPVMRWFTGNIGFHHVHHLNPRIPFYRLPQAMAGIPELASAGITLSPKTISASFRLKLWDPERERMVGFPRRS